MQGIYILLELYLCDHPVLTDWGLIRWFLLYGVGCQSHYTWMVIYGDCPNVDKFSMCGLFIYCPAEASIFIKHHQYIKEGYGSIFSLFFTGKLDMLVNGVDVIQEGSSL